MSRSFQRCLCTRNWWPFCRKVRVVPRKRTVFQQHRSAMIFERRGGWPSCRWSTHWEISNPWWNRLQSKICWGNLGWDTVRTSQNHTSLIAVFLYLQEPGSSIETASWLGRSRSKICFEYCEWQESLLPGLLTGAPLKVLSVRLHSKSHQKSSKCQDLLTGWHLELLGGHQLKKTPCNFESNEW